MCNDQNHQHVWWALTKRIWTFVLFYLWNHDSSCGLPSLGESLHEVILACELCVVCPLSWYLRATGLFLKQQWYNWDNSAPFSLSDFYKPRVSYQFLFFGPTPSHFNQSPTEWLHGAIIVFISNSWLMLLHSSGHSQRWSRGSYSICQPCWLKLN